MSTEIQVRPLEWTAGEPGTCTLVAPTPWGRYTIWEIGGRNYWIAKERPGQGTFGDLIAVKAAAQADYEQRIRRALATPVSPAPEAKDGAYLERNQVVAALAKCFPSGIAKTAIEGWSDDWHGCVYIDLPTGQVSWHFHDSQAYLFEGMPPYKGEWDGHDTPEKYRRLAALSGQTAVPVAWRMWEKEDGGWWRTTSSEPDAIYYREAGFKVEPLYATPVSPAPDATDICIDCDGAGRYPSGAVCKSCGGSGRVLPGDGISAPDAGWREAFDEMLAALTAVVDQLDHEDTGEPGLSARDWIAHWQALHDNAAAAISKAQAAGGKAS